MAVLRRSALRLPVLLLALGLAAGIVFGFLGRWHPAFDSWSHFRLHLAFLLFISGIALFWLRYPLDALLAIALSAGSVWIIAPYLPAVTQNEAASRGYYRLLQLNLRYDNPDMNAVLSAIGRLKPDVITVEEVSPAWAEKLKLIGATYRYGIVCPPPSFIGGVAVLSRRPFAAGTTPVCTNEGAFAQATIDFNGETAEVVALHLGWPWPFEQAWNVDTIAPDLREIGDTAIVAGDFNAAPWSRTVQRVAELGRLRVLGGIGPTWLSYRLPVSWRGWVGLPIDNVLAKGGVEITSIRRDVFAGSDHLPVVVDFNLRPAPGAPAVMQAKAATY